MNLISPISSLWQQLSSAQTSQATPVNALAPLVSNVDSAIPRSTASTSTTDAAQLSDPGKLFQELESLSKSNPTDFKKITAQIASELKTAAGQSTSSTESSFLTQMATNFSNASQSGKFSDLFANSGQRAGAQASSGTTPVAHHHHHHGGNAESSQTDSVSNIFSQALQQIQTDISSGPAGSTVKS